MNIPVHQWKWYGSPVHFFGARECGFHLVTEIGPYVVSTIGDWVPHSALVSFPDVDAYRKDYPDGEGLGDDRNYETMVFKVDGYCSGESCNCGAPGHNNSELDSAGYETREEANKGHLAMCYKVALGKLNTPQD